MDRVGLRLLYYFEGKGLYQQRVNVSDSTPIKVISPKSAQTIHPIPIQYLGNLWRQPSQIFSSGVFLDRAAGETSARLQHPDGSTCCADQAPVGQWTILVTEYGEVTDDRNMMPHQTGTAQVAAVAMAAMSAKHHKKPYKNVNT